MNDTSSSDTSPDSAPDDIDSTRQRKALALALVVTVIAGIATVMSFRPSAAASSRVLAYVGVTYGILAAVTLGVLVRRGELRGRMRLRFGDVSLSALMALTLYFASVVIVAFLVDSPREAWIARVYLHLGDPATTRTVAVAGVVVFVAACEEVVWRGLVNTTLVDAFGSLRGVVGGTLLYALAHASTIYLLRDPAAGFNPLVFIAAAGCGLVWGVVANQAERLPPSIAAHALFTWSVVMFPLWRL